MSWLSIIELQIVKFLQSNFQILICLRLSIDLYERIVNAISIDINSFMTWIERQNNNIF